MTRHLAVVASVLILAGGVYAAGPQAFNTKWIPAKPELLTYKSTGGQGEGLYQLSISQRDTTIEVFLNIITPGFTKTVSGSMRLDMKPLRSTSKIIVDGQVVMDTRCAYGEDSLHIMTEMQPYNQRVGSDLRTPEQFVDFSQIPFIVRTLPLGSGKEFSFSSLNPRTNGTAPFTAKVTGEGVVHAIECYKIATKDFEGESIYWVEKGGQRRILRIEQPIIGRVTELMW